MFSDHGVKAALCVLPMLYKDALCAVPLSGFVNFDHVVRRRNLLKEYNMDSSRAGGDMFLIKSCVDRVVVEESDEEKVKEEDENVKEEKEEKKDEEEKEEKVAEEETKEDKVTIDFEAPEWLINAALELNNQDVALTRTWLSEHAKMYILGKDLGDEEEKMTKLNDEDFDDAAVGVQAFEHLVLLNRHTHTQTQQTHSGTSLISFGRCGILPLRILKLGKCQQYEYRG